MQLRDDRLDQRRDREGVVHAGLRVADAHLECVEEGMQSNVPPDFFGIVDAPGSDQ